jgi:hypothetical protein
MGPFDEHQQVVSAAPRCCQTARCPVCSGRSAQLSRRFFAIVQLTWNPAEMNLLIKAANSALL